MHVEFSRSLLRSAALLVTLLFFCLEVIQAATLEVRPNGGVFASNVTVTLSGPGREIRYTLDGTSPGTNSPLYAAPLLLTNSALLKVRSVETNATLGPISVHAYTLLDSNVATFTSTLPLVILETFGRAIETTNVEVFMHCVNTDTNQRAMLTGSADHRGFAKVKRRGYTSRRYPKPSLAVETIDADGESQPASLLGLPKDEDWILYAPYPDKSLIRDVLAYQLSNELGHYASRTKFVEVFLNNTTGRVSRAHYVGVYVLEEKLKIAPSRVAMKKLSPKDKAEPEITGGYIFKKDHFEKAGDPSEVTPRPLMLRARYPSGPGGFPSPASGFLPPTEEPALANALAVITNGVSVTNVVAGTNVVVAPPSVTIVRTNTTFLTNTVSVTNALVVTNLVLATNFPVVTNVAVSSRTVIGTNPVVAAQSVAATNTVATTNQIDAHTAVISTTLAISTSTTFRTNYQVFTNVVAITNSSVVTNVVVATNHLVVTNASIAAMTVIETNRSLVTNVYLLGAGDPLSPYAEKLLATKEGFITRHTNVFFFVEPKATKITDGQREWLTNHLNQFEQALYGPSFRNPTNGYAAFIDVDSFIDHHLFVEATKNIDGFRFSAYFTKDRAGRIRMQPIWDWNLSFGNARGKQGYMPEYWYWPQLTDQQYPWFRRLFEDPDFGQRYIDRWAQWRTNVFSNAHLLRRVDELASTLKEPAARNFERWPILGQIVDAEYFAPRTYDEEIQYLKTWITNRLAWIDSQFPPPPLPSRPGGLLVTNDVITFSAPTGQIFFTVDGSDPRFAGGSTSRVAHVYQAPISVSNSVSITARAQKDNRWSSPVTSRFIKTASAAR